MIRDKEIQELQNEIADLRRKEAQGQMALAKANETIKTSTEIGDVERAWVTANAAVATRNNIATRIAGIEKKIDDLRNDQQAFRSELESVPERVEAKKAELQRLRRRRNEQEGALARLRTQAQSVADELARLPKPIAVAGAGTWQDGKAVELRQNSIRTSEPDHRNVIQILCFGWAAEPGN
jgi:chromosome segregation ATPase